MTIPTEEEIARVIVKFRFGHSEFHENNKTELWNDCCEIARAVLALLPRREAGGETIERAVRTIDLLITQSRRLRPGVTRDLLVQAAFDLKALVSARALSPSDGGEWNEQEIKAAIAVCVADVNSGRALGHAVRSAILSLKRPPVPQEDE